MRREDEAWNDDYFSMPQTIYPEQKSSSIFEGDPRFLKRISNQSDKDGRTFTCRKDLSERPRTTGYRFTSLAIENI